MTSSVAIIGGGISGTLTVLNCIKQSKKQLNIIWFDAAGLFCKGLAYSTLHDEHLLNVRANNMSAFADEPEHFTNWLSKKHYAYLPKDFVPRKLFGEYLCDLFNDLKNSNPLVKVVQYNQEVVSIKQQENGYVITAGQTYTATKIILAFGNFLPSHPNAQSSQFISSPQYFQNAFSQDLIPQTQSKKSITIIGSGLTMLDTVLTLNTSYKQNITVISPHGYLPQAHHESLLPAVKPYINETTHYSLSQLVSLVNQQLKTAKAQNLNPHSVIDVMRPYVQNIWLHFSLPEKKQFLRHLRHKWGVARHRAPAKSIQVVDQLIKDGRLQIVKGRIFDIKTNGSEFEIYYSTSQNSSKSFTTQLIVNCTGPQSNYNTVKMPLVQQLLNDGIIVVDDIKYGINAQKDGQIAKNLYTLGPPLKGILWESTAVPEIRVQAKELAAKIICD